MSGKVYFISIKDAECRLKNPYLKIGWTTDLKDRMSSLQTGSPVELDVFGYINSCEPIKLEKYFHKMFLKDRVCGEWFRVSTAMINKISAYNVQSNRLDEFFIPPTTESNEVLQLKADIDMLRKTIEEKDKIIKENCPDYYPVKTEYHNRYKEREWGRFMRNCKLRSAKIA